MEVLYVYCDGLDVHKKTVVACRLSVNAAGQKVKVIETFGTTTSELLRLSDWLTAGHCTHVAMESTGEFWKPVWNILEGSFSQGGVASSGSLGGTRAAGSSAGSSATRNYSGSGVASRGTLQGSAASQ